MRPAQLPERLPGRRGESSRRMGRAEMLTHRVEVEPDCAADATRERDACSARSIAILTTSSRLIDARAPRDAPLLRHAHQAQAAG